MNYSAKYNYTDCIVNGNLGRSAESPLNAGTVSFEVAHKAMCTGTSDFAHSIANLVSSIFNLTGHCIANGASLRTGGSTGEKDFIGAALLFFGGDEWSDDVSRRADGFFYTLAVSLEIAHSAVGAETAANAVFSAGPVGACLQLTGFGIANGAVLGTGGAAVHEHFVRATFGCLVSRNSQDNGQKTGGSKDELHC